MGTLSLFIEDGLKVVVKGLNDKDGVMLAQLADERFQLLIVGKTLYQHNNRLTGIISIFPLANGLLINQYISDIFLTDLFLRMSLTLM